MVDQFDPSFTENVIKATGPKTDPRMRQVMTALIRHLHDFAREVELTVDEWMEGVNLINWAGQMSNDKRNEGQLVCDVLGLESRREESLIQRSLVDEITFSRAANAPDAATATAILGPFFRTDAPHYPNGSSIIKTPPADGEVTYMHGKVVDSATGEPIEGVVIDIWEASTNGMYEQQDPDQADCPAGKILQLLDRHPMRPAHIHLIATHKDYKPITTQIFDSEDKYLADDSVFAVKHSLIVNFKALEGNDKATREVEYDLKLKKQSTAN
ncbi:catechol dioxygenase [Emydomyces testavorans]|uniref:Catechol dioxygenase n=1 Tax=Emydomyces testavorans TaxID=2070801 RepID=A0AAF0DGQ0_9EURO|nr:catechol dioxygenase [Emydomyces testavorans]